MYKVGNRLSFEYSFTDGIRKCTGVVSHIHNSGMGYVIALDNPHKDKNEVFVLSQISDLKLIDEEAPIPNIPRKSDFSIGDNIKFRHEDSTAPYENGDIVFVYNDGVGYFVNLGGLNNDKFFLSNNMIVKNS